MNPQDLPREFALLGDKIASLAATRQQLVAQLNENEGVRAELELLSEDSELYRTLGPAALRIDKVEAKTLVEGRLERIRAELKKLEAQVETVGQKRLAIQTELQRVAQQQQQQQSKQQQQQGGVPTQVNG